jgi:hypothetical protein
LRLILADLIGCTTGTFFASDSEKDISPIISFATLVAG